MTTPEFLDKAGTSSPPAIVVVKTNSNLKKLLAIVGRASMIYMELIGQHQVAYNIHGCVRLGQKNANRGWGSRGPLSVVVLRAFPNPDIFVVDMNSLGRTALTGRTFASSSFKTVLESPRMLKVMWDLFDPVDMLWTQFGIRLQNGLDLQLVENAARKTSKFYLDTSLEVALKTDLRLSKAELAYNTKCRRVIEERIVLEADLEPLSTDSPLLQYCANCVRYMPRLFFKYMDRTDGEWLTKARNESARRITVALGRSRDLRSPSKALGPWGTGEPFRYMNFR
ncbi:3 -5 exonuclease [Ophiostoma piceae UAMH 11346]|uniref:3-5 exonuclease n=1 Tax=Ophiostoma piceae (strain UAMH 11346) TaxID=1262450 RepID=S3C2N8_OPHP1|nr:3 -5 exonuclease [Ophiostoma piceae UAMH 11346]